MKTLEPRECPQCYKEFVPKNPDQNYCSASCRGQMGAEARDYRKTKSRWNKSPEKVSAR